MRLLQRAATILVLTVLVGCQSPYWHTWTDVSASGAETGGRLALVTRRESGNSLSLYLIDQQTGTRKELAQDISAAMPPVFRMNGDKLFFLRYSYGFQLFSLDLTSGQQTQVGTIDCSEQHLRVYPSCTKLLFASYMEGWFSLGESYQVFDMDTGQLRTITPKQAPEFVSLSAIGNQLLYSSQGKYYAVDLATGKESTLTDADAKYYSPRFGVISRDGKYFAFSAGKAKDVKIDEQGLTDGLPDFENPDNSKYYHCRDSRELLLVDLTAGTQKSIAAGTLGKPVFSPDSQSLTFVCDNRLWIYDITTAKAKTFSAPRYKFGAAYSWFGKRVIFQDALKYDQDLRECLLTPDTDAHPEIWELGKP